MKEQADDFEDQIRRLKAQHATELQELRQ